MSMSSGNECLTPFRSTVTFVTVPTIFDTGMTDELIAPSFIAIGSEFVKGRGVHIGVNVAVGVNVGVLLPVVSLIVTVAVVGAQRPTPVNEILKVSFPSMIESPQVVTNTVFAVSPGLKVT